MSDKDRCESQIPDNPIEAALHEFREAWHEGKRPDPDAFCESRPKCGPELREKIESFLLAVKDFSEVGVGKEEEPSVESGTDEALSGKTIGDFQIIREIGRGGMGAVYEAEQISLRRRVALKVLYSHLSFSEDSVLKFRREAEAGGRQQHPGIVAIYAVGEHEGIHYIAQELVEEGRTLDDKLEELQKGGKLPIGYFREAAGLIAEVADALSHAHATGVIHRDIKPSNILLTQEGAPRITDFGLAKVEDGLALSRTGDFAGTPYYMSPEQAASRRMGIDHRTDIFSLGITLYELLTLSRPFPGATSHEVFKKILLADPRDPRKVNSRVPQDLAVICLKAMEKMPEARYQTMVEFADDLKRFLNGEMILARPLGAMSKLMKRARRNLPLSAAVAVASAALLILLVAVIVDYFLTLEDTNRIYRLSDVNVLLQLKKKASQLWPEYPYKINDMVDWLEDAEKLVKHLPTHRETLQNLRKKGEPTKEGIGIKSEWIFDNDELQWEHDTLNKLIKDLEDFTDLNIQTNKKIDEGKATIEHVKDRLSFARTIENNSIVDYQENWDQAIASIANEDECPIYKKLKIKEQIGLVPLGQDPDSGLWEFAHLRTGNKIPIRRPDEKLDFNEDCGLVFVLIPGGKFYMGAKKAYEDLPVGSDNVDPYIDEYNPYEINVREVEIKPFFLSKYEMCQAQWKRFSGENPSIFQPENIRYRIKNSSTLHPVEGVSWRDCDEVLSRLRLRFPSESEWEYACRAGTTTVWWTGNNMESLAGETPELCAANVNDISHSINGWKTSWTHEEWDDGYAGTAPVNHYQPNPFGLHNICGNVWEWCQDIAHLSYIGAPCDGSAWMSEKIGNPVPTLRVVRGGLWFLNAWSCRSAARYFFPMAMQAEYAGVRPARDLYMK